MRACLMLARVYTPGHTLFTGQRKREKKEIEREREKEGGERERVRCGICLELFLFLKGMAGTFAPFSYVV